MPYRDYRIVAFTPAGRKRVMSLLLDNLERHRNIVDEYQIWINTDEEQEEDNAWLRSLPDMYDWVTLIERPNKDNPLTPKQMNTGLFYPNTTDEKTIYVRFDDDIIFIDDNFFVNLLDFRIDNPDYFLVFANIWNNAIMSYIHQQLGNIPATPVIEEPYCMEPTAWRSGKFAESIHETLLEHIQNNTTHELYFGAADLHQAMRFSISCFCFFGKDFKKFNGVVGIEDEVVRWDEEVWLTEVYPTLEEKMSTICGSALVAHYSFFAQRPHLDQTDILLRYKRVTQQKLSGSYYDLLDEANEAEKGKTVKRKVKKGKQQFAPFALPKLQHMDSPALVAMKARMLGYKAYKTQSGYEIRRDDKLLAKLGGEPTGNQINSMILRMYQKYEQ